MKYLTYILLVLFCFTFSTCKKDNSPPTTLPPATQTGANTFGCKINGDVWVPYSPCDLSASPCGEMDVSVLSTPNTILPLGVSLNFTRNNKGKRSDFNIGFTASDTGNVFNSLDITYLSENFNSGSEGPFEKVTRQSSNWIVTKFDTLNKIVSGTFNLTLSDREDSVVITDGRFDFQLQGLCRCSQ